MTTDERTADSQAGTSWWRRRSLRARLTAAATVLIAVGMAAAAVLLVWRVHSVLTADLDTTLTRQIRLIADDVAAGDPLPRMLRSGESTVMQVIGTGGTVIDSSGDIDGEPRIFSGTPGVGEPQISTVTNEALDDTAYRVAALSAPSPTGAVTIYVGSPTSPLTNSITQLGTALLVGVPAMIALLALVGWWLLGTALRPVDVMGRQAAAIPGTDLARRLEVPAARDELGRLAETFNDLLGRIEAAAGRQRRFVADAAHELRTPLAALRARLEIDLRHPATGADAASTQLVVLGQVTRLADLVNDLLQLARLDADPQLQRRPVDLDDLVWDAARDAREQGSPRLDTTGISPVRVLGDPAALRQVVRNLLDNARRHAHHTVTLRLSIDTTSAHAGSVQCSSAQPTATLIVADDGTGIPTDERQRVFERFVRLDEARARDGGGAGLGLAIVADIVTALSGRVWVDDNQPGARFHVQLPILPTADADSTGARTS